MYLVKEVSYHPDPTVRVQRGLGLTSLPLLTSHTTHVILRPQNIHVSLLQFVLQHQKERHMKKS